MDADVVVVGAGMAGLACARTLQGAGRHVVVLESSDGPGGRVRSDVVDGFILDRGFQILLTGYPELVRWFDLDDLDLRRFRPGATIWIGDRFTSVGDPLRDPSSILTTVISPVGSIVDKARLLRLIASVRRGSPRDLLRRPDRSTAAELDELGFSDRFIERFFEPLFAGVQLDPELEVSSRRFEIILRMLATGDAAVPAAGMGSLSARLAAGLDAGTIRTGAAVVRIEGTRAILADGTAIEGRSVVVATSAPVASALVGTPDPGSSPVAAVWFDTTEAPIDDRRIILDGARSGPVRNLASMSAVAPDYAPKGRSCAVAAIPGPYALADGLDYDVRRQLSTWLPESASWTILRTDVIPHGQPRQLPPLEPSQSVRLDNGRYVCGDHRDTASIQGALHSGRRTAAAVLSDLGRRA